MPFGNFGNIFVFFCCGLFGFFIFLRLFLDQEMVYSLDSDETPYVPPVKNRFTGDWVALHMMSTICRLTDQRNASYNFLKNGGMGVRPEPQRAARIRFSTCCQSG